MNRRAFLQGLGAGCGATFMNPIMANESMNPLAPKKPHHTPKAKACIVIFLEGGPSHIDTFDPKPALDKLHLKKFETKKFINVPSSVMMEQPF